MDQVLSLDLLNPIDEKKVDASDDEVAWIEGKLIERTNAKKNKDWSTADLIRDELKAKGITIVDTAEGAKWSKD